MYDFKTLSAYDFELLVRDLLQKILGVVIESFKSGRDNGIDLRYASTGDQSLVVQCKHYAETGYRGLLASLKKERPKVNRLAPDRYCVATSVSLSPDMKQEIMAIFAPYCRSEKDIFSSEDLNNLLNLNQDIERQHYKLWLTSTNVLERILHSDLYNQTELLVKRIQQKTRCYVQNKSFFDALALLREYRYCIISGNPGIGKTFLAEILLLEHIRNGFEPVVVRSHISEAFKLLKGNTRQIFYYDDFLGQTGWEDKLGKNEEQSILDFISYVREHEHAAFILTTREYILQQARAVYEKLHASNFDSAKCIIEIGSYTRRNRAHILLNHLYFSDLTPDHKKALALKKNLLTIIDHPNYSPRIVEWMSGLQNIQDCIPAEYPELFIKTLNDPENLWLHAYRKHLTPAARSMLLVLFSFQSAVDIGDLREAYESFRYVEAQRFNSMRAPDEFTAVLDELEGSFIRCERNANALVVAFHNPSVRDFLEKHMSTNSDQALLLCDSLIFYDQFRGVFTPQSIRYQRNPAKIEDGLDLESISAAALRTVTRIAKCHTLYIRYDGTARANTMISTSVELNIAHAIRMAKELPSSERETITTQLLFKEERRIKEGTVSMSDLPQVLSAAKSIPEISDMYQRLIGASTSLYDDADDYEDLEQFVVLENFISEAPGVIDECRLRLIGEKLSEDGGIIFESAIHHANDESELDDLEKVATSFERAFDITLETIYELIEEKREEVQICLDESSDDWLNSVQEEKHDAGDDEIIDMFGSISY